MHSARDRLIPLVSTGRRDVQIRSAAPRVTLRKQIFQLIRRLSSPAMSERHGFSLESQIGNFRFESRCGSFSGRMPAAHAGCRSPKKLHFDSFHSMGYCRNQTSSAGFERVHCLPLPTNRCADKLVRSRIREHSGLRYAALSSSEQVESGYG